jgi:hypothetical protein
MGDRPRGQGRRHSVGSGEGGAHEGRGVTGEDGGAPPARILPASWEELASSFASASAECTEPLEQAASTAKQQQQRHGQPPSQPSSAVLETNGRDSDQTELDAPAENFSRPPAGKHGRPEKILSEQGSLLYCMKMDTVSKIHCKTPGQNQPLQHYRYSRYRIAAAAAAERRCAAARLCDCPASCRTVMMAARRRPAVQHRCHRPAPTPMRHVAADQQPPPCG